MNTNEYLDALERAERYRLLVEGVQDYAIFMLDKEGYVVTWNTGAQKLKGYKAAEIIGKHFSIFFPKDKIDDHTPDHELENAKKNGSSEVNGWRIKKDGSKFWANVVITALYSNGGELMGYAKVTRDLTERKLHEEELISANQELEKQRSELVELNTVKDEFVSLVSHQLRAPATGVKQYLGMLLEGYAGALAPEQRKFIQNAYDSNDRQISMVNDLLQVVQVDSGRVVLTKIPTNIAALTKDVIKEQQNVFEARNQKINIINKTKSVVFVDTDKMRLRMVIENLIDNASKYTPHGGTITAIVEVTKNEAKIHIQDTGVGIKKSEISKLFTKFSRIPNHLSQQVGGSGLGLYWAHKVIELHSGTITVVSKPNVGSTFTIVLPRSSVAVTE